MKDLFDKIYRDKGPLGKWASQAEGYFVFPKLEGQISNRMHFQGKEVITWSINDYLGLANHPEVIKFIESDGEQQDIEPLSRTKSKELLSNGNSEKFPKNNSACKLS